MDRLGEFLEVVKQQAQPGDFLGLMHILVGRRVTKADGSPVSDGLTWRALAALLKRVRWDKNAVRELGVDPAHLPPRDRQRYWYSAISFARVDSPQAFEAGDRLAERLCSRGYVISPGRPV
jgi:hypothetical protein